MIETERLLLRFWDIKDIDDLIDGLNNINVTKWMSHTPYPFTKEDAIEYINRPNNTENYNFAIVLKSENKVIGGTQIRNIDHMQGTASGGIWINEKYHGHGYGKEAWGARIEYAFEKLNLRRLENGFFEGNDKSWNMQESFGYKLEGTRRQKYKCLSTGKLVDEHITALLKDEWIRR